MAVEFYVHKMSEHMETAEILNWLVQEGERVEKYQVILEVLTDKVTAALESPAEGFVKGIRPGAVAGATVPVGVPLCYIADAEEEVPALPPLDDPSAAPQPPATGAGEVREGRMEPDASATVRSTPVARKLAEELGVDIRKVRGTGPQGRVTEKDVRNWAAAADRTTDQPADAVFLELTPIQRLTGERMLDSVAAAPQFSLELSVNMSEALRLRGQLAAPAADQPSITSLVVKAAAVALRQHPRANAHYAGGRLEVPAQVNVAVAVDTEEGLVVPVIREADRQSLTEIGRKLRLFQEKARSTRFSSDELDGATFTVSNLGMLGVDRFRAIINPPQSAILAVGRIAQVPVGRPDNSIALQPMMSLTLTADHRCLDGAAAARFLTAIRDLLEAPHMLEP